MTDWLGKPYYSLDAYLKKTFGEKVYKLSLDGGMTCPNRDGTCGDRGCIFCSAGGSGDFAGDRNKSIPEQIREQKSLLQQKRPVHKFIAYFQAYTNTYAPVEYLEKIFTEAISHPKIVALSIGTRPDCLSPEIVTLLSRLNKQKPGIEKINKDILKTLELYSDQSGFNNAAALLADDNQFTGIDIIRFGDTIDEIMDRESLENISILSQLEKTLQMFRKYYQYEKIEGAERKCIDKIPEKAFREAIANALIHRMWDIPASIKVSMYADRIEISSPGGLPAGISEEEYLNGQISILRNPIIGNVFFRLKYIEKFGTGIMRINHAYRNALIKPSYQCFSNSIKVILPVIRENYDLNEAEQILVNILKGKEKMSRSEIEKAAEMEKSKAVRTLNSLIEKKILKKTGAGRGVRYTLK